MNALTLANIVEELLEAVPEVQKEYDEWREFFDENRDDVPIYILLGCVLNPYLLPLLDGESDSDEEPLRHTFAFLERAATSGNSRIEDAVAIEFVEHLLGDTVTKRRTKAWQYMGDAMKKMYTDMEDWWKQHGDEYRRNVARNAEARSINREPPTVV